VSVKRVLPGQLWTFEPTNPGVYRTFEVEANRDGTVFLREITVGPVLEEVMLRSERWQLVEREEES
jgi:hypothetical protein